MSTQGWREFVEAAEIDEWVLLHGGATAVYRTGSLADAAALASALAQLPGLEGSGVKLSLADGQLTVRLNPGIFRLERVHLDLARAISAVAAAHGVVGDRAAVQEVQFAISARPDELDVDFWRAALGYEPRAEDNAADPLGHGSTVWLQELDPRKPLRHAMHVDVSVAREHVEDRVAAAIAAGGRVVYDAESPGHRVVSDRAGNKVCICAWPDGG